MQISYEHLLLNQNVVVPKLLQFANLKPDDSITQKFWSWTHANSKIVGGFNSKRSRNASINMNSWKNALPKSDLKLINENESCKLLINEIELRKKKLTK